MKEKALSYLRAALVKPEADFREGQWEAIEDLLNHRRLLVVQRTGWGKSMVYFMATRLLRDRGEGVTLLISPLLSLMRNQLEAAERIGVRAATINSTNRDDWDVIEAQLRRDEIDVLLISPERLANESFRQKVLVPLAAKVGLFVVDEAHCISDWGHDFRPDYRRIVRVLQNLPLNIPVLATTATANDRVVHDVISQLGDGVELVRGPLVRESLMLQNISIPSPSARMAWLAQTIPDLPNSGIVYTLTVRDAERVAEWLRINDIAAKAYHAKTADDREALERELLDNGIKVLVATVALGMGFDKPDLGFVIHFQRPGSVVHYYQQVGRAGRAVDQAYGILLHGEEDQAITEYFIKSAFPPQAHLNQILKSLDEADGGLSVRELEGGMNLTHGAIEKTLKFLSVESPSPITKIGSKWNVTATAQDYQIDQEYVGQITAIRHAEQKQMVEYMAHGDCLMEFLGRALDDPSAGPCGKCAGCMGAPLLSLEVNDDLANRAAIFLKRSYQPLKPRKQWPAGGALKEYGFSGNLRSKSTDLIAEEGRALSLWRDAGWGQLVADGKYVHGRFDDQLVTASVEMLEQWQPHTSPEWVCCIPSLRHPELVPDFAYRLAEALGLPFVSTAICKVKECPEQKTMQNSFQQASNLDGVFGIGEALPEGPCLLVDDMRDSGWTFTIAAALLRRAGVPAVFPLALALNSPRMD